MLFKKYTKKPVEISAVQLTKYNSLHIISDIVANDGDARVVSEGVLIRTLEGEMLAGYGDWIIKGTKGEYYPCKDEIFRNLHEGFEDE